MARIKVSFNGKQVGQQFSTRMRKIANAYPQHARAALEDVREESLDRGRQNISSAGNFGSRWTEGLRGTITKVSNDDLNLVFSHDVPYFMVHQTGRLIRGKPFLAIPMSFADDAQGVLARNYPGGLFRVDRKAGGAPLLLSRKTGEVKYFLKRQVYVPKRFRVIEIIRETARKFKDYFKGRIRNG